MNSIHISLRQVYRYTIKPITNACLSIKLIFLHSVIDIVIILSELISDIFPVKLSSMGLYILTPSVSANNSSLKVYGIYSVPLLVILGLPIVIFCKS